MTGPGTSFADPGGAGASGSDSRDVQVNLTADVSGYTDHVNAAEQATTGLATGVDKLVASLGNLGKFAGKQLFRFAAADAGVLTASIADAASLQHQLGTLRATASVTGTSMSSMSNQLDKAFTSFPAARRDLVALAETITNLGVSAPKAVGRAVGTFTKLGAATGESPIGLATGNLQLNRQMGNFSSEATDKYANSLLVVSKSQGVAASGVLEFAQAIAPMSRAAGIGEAAVLGISGAFQKAGADGAYAANTFNKIITDISTLSQTGSPELGKYATFAGKSTEEFKRQSATTQATQVFEGVARGGPEALGFMSSIGASPREIRAIQAVAQTGGLKGPIAEATKAAQGTAELDKASEEALHGLTDSTINVGNEFTKLGELLGGPFLGVLTKIVDAFDSFMGLVNKVVKSLGPIPGILAAVAGAAAVPAGFALAHAGAIGTAALARTVFGQQSMGRVAYRQGRAAGVATAAGMDPLDAMAMSSSGQRIQAGTANWRTQYPFMAGMNAGQRPPSAFQQRFGTNPLGLVGRGVSGLAGGVMGAGTWLLNQQTGTLQQSSMPGPQRPANSGRGGFPGFMASVRTGAAQGPLRAAAGTAAATVRAGAATVGTLGTLTGAVIGGAARLTAMGVPQGPLALPAPSTPGLLARAGGALFSPVGMIATMIGVPLIGALMSSMKQRQEKRDDTTEALSGSTVYDQALDRASTGLSKFGQSVDAASDRLAKFANTPTSELENLGTVTGEDIAAVQGGGYQVSDPKLRSIIEGASTAASQPGGDPDAIKNAVTAYLDSQAQQAPITGSSFTKYKQDILSIVGSSGSREVTEIMSAFGKRQAMGGEVTPDYGKLATLAQQSAPGKEAGKPGLPDDEQLENFKRIYGAGVSGVVGGTQDYGIEGQRVALANMMSMGAKATGAANKGQAARIGATNQILAEQFGIDPDKLKEGITKAGQELGTGASFVTSGINGKVGAITTKTPYGNEQDALAVQVKAFAATDKGKEVLNSMGWDESQLLQAAQKPPAMPPPAASGTVTRLEAEGPLGLAAAGSKSFTDAAIGQNVGKPGAAFSAANELVAKAASLAGGDLNKAASELDHLSNAIGGMSDPAGRLIGSAADQARQLANFKLPSMSNEEQLITKVATARRDVAAANELGATDKTVEQGRASQAEGQAAQESYKQGMIARIKQLKQFSVEQTRAEDSNALQVRRINRDYREQEVQADYEYRKSRSRSIEDFGVQQERSLEDFHTQYARSQEEFGIQQVRSQENYDIQVLRTQEDYQLQRLRAQEEYQISADRATADHLRDLSRQAQSAAQTIYDPFTRVQVQATTDAGTLIYNLKEQNADIARQMDEIEELKKRGVSQQTIDTLNLAAPENAQQVTTLASSLQQNPGMTDQINKLVAERVASTTALVQSPNSIAFRQSEEDYKQSMDRASEDFSRSQKHMAEDHSKTMLHMSQDFQRTTKQAAADQARALRNMSTDFEKNRARAQTDQDKTLARMSKDFSDAQALALKNHKKGLSDLAVDFELVQKHAAEDLAASMVQYNGTFTQVFTQLSAIALANLGDYGTKASAIITRELKTIADANPWLTGEVKPKVPSAGEHSGSRAGGNRQDATPAPSMGEHSGSRSDGVPDGGGRAFGGISLTTQRVTVGEHGPELHLPLNSRGESFLAGLITKSLVRGVTTATATAPSAMSTTNDNSISFNGADIRVVAQDPNQMAKELAAKAKLSRLASPVRH